MKRLAQELATDPDGARAWSSRVPLLDFAWSRFGDWAATSTWPSPMR